jgi:hypothetical protein
VDAPARRPTPTDAEVEAARALLAEHLLDLRAEEWVQHVEHDPEIDRWYLRFGCDGRDAATIYLELRQRSLHHELYFLPAPEDEGRRSELHAWLLRRNHQLRGTRFSVGPDGDVYLVGRTPIEHLDHAELDRLVGALYEATEQWFQAAVRIAYGPRARTPRTGPSAP